MNPTTLEYPKEPGEFKHLMKPKGVGSGGQAYQEAHVCFPTRIVIYFHGGEFGEYTQNTK